MLAVGAPAASSSVAGGQRGWSTALGAEKEAGLWKEEIQRERRITGSITISLSQTRWCETTGGFNAVVPALDLQAVGRRSGYVQTRQCLSRVFRNALPLPSPGVVLRFLRTPSVRTSGTLPLSQRPRRPMHECVKGSSQPGCKDVLGRQHERHPGGCRFPSPL